MHVGGVAKKIGLTPDAIRFYERTALLPRPSRTAGGFAIPYAPHAQWRDEPASSFWNGPAVHVIPTLETSLHNMK